MTARSFFAATALLFVPVAANAQGGQLTFDRAAYVTCHEAQAMQPDARRQLAVFLAQHAARYRGITLPTDERGGQLGMLVRSGCTLAPDSYLFTVIDRAIVAEKTNLAGR